jgi:molecular chaperone DnaK (HSP70)
LAVIAIDLGSSHSGYAFSVTFDASRTVHLMRGESCRSGVSADCGQKWPTCILVRPDGQLHSFGQLALDAYHALSASEARRWMLFERFKMPLYVQDASGRLNRNSRVQAVNGNSASALHVLALAIRYLAGRAMQHLRQVCGRPLSPDSVRWVLTVPAVWKAPAKQLMRQAAYEAGLIQASSPEQLLIALEPEAASVYCRTVSVTNNSTDERVRTAEGR